MTYVKEILLDEEIVESEILGLKSMAYGKEKAESKNTSDRKSRYHE